MSAGADPLDAGALIAALHRHAVDYMVIGGIALQAHGHVRTTQDLDIFTVADTPGAPRSYEVLRQHAIPIEVRGITVLTAHPEHLIRMKTAAAELRDRPGAKRRQDLDDVAVLTRLLDADRPQSGPAAPLRHANPTRRTAPRPPRQPGPTLEP